MNIKETAVLIHANNVAKGFWSEEKKNVGEALMLVVSELAEALEADRKGRKANIACYEAVDQTNRMPGDAFSFESTIKDTFEDEIADAVIRLFDLSEGFGIDLEWHIRQKMAYNSTRPFKHGKQY